MTVITRPVLETEVAKTLIVNHVSPALQVDWPGLGNGSFTVPLTAGGASVLDVAGYRKLSIRVGSTRSPTVDLIMGMIDPTTLASRYQFAPDDKIHTFDVVGPQIMLSLLNPGRGTAAEKVQLWLYLSA